MNRLVRNRSSCGQTRHPSRQGIRGFTLTEVLVTMAIMASLLGVLLGSVRQLQDRAKDARDRRNLQTLYIGVVSYAQEHEGSFPKVTNLAEADQQVRAALEPYLKDKKFFSRLPPMAWRYGPYPELSLNSVKLDQIRNPGLVPIAGEQFSPGRGKGKVLVLFADGHVERLTPEELSRLLMAPLMGEKIEVTRNPDGSVDIQSGCRQGRLPLSVTPATPVRRDFAPATP